MEPKSRPSKKENPRQVALNMTLTIVAGSVGCLTLVIVLAAVFIGLMLDARFQSKPTFTLILVLGSVPISLVLMFAIVRAAVARMKTRAGESQSNAQEDRDLGAN